MDFLCFVVALVSLSASCFIAAFALFAFSALLLFWKSFYPKLKVLLTRRLLGNVVFGMATIAFVYKLSHLGAADFGAYKHYFIALVLLGGALAPFFIPDFLGTRGFCGLVLMTSHAFLQSAYMLYELPARLFLVILTYCLILLSMHLTVFPYHWRDFFEYLQRKRKTRLCLGSFLLAYALLLSTLGFQFS